MPVSGLVAVLSEDVQAAEQARVALRRDERLTIGDAPTPERQPLVLETTDAAEHHAAIKHIENIPGVRLLEIAYVDFSDVSARPAPSERSPRSPAP